MSLLAAAQSRADYQATQLPVSGIIKPLKWLSGWFDGVDTPSGIKVDADNAISLSTVFNALTILSESVAQLPVSPMIIEQKDGRDSKRKYIEHPTYRLVAKQPNEWMSSQTFRKVMMNHLVRYDRAYSLISFNGSGRPAELFPLHPKWAQTKITPDRRIVYEVTDYYGTGESVIIRSEEMLHVIGYTENGLEGKSRIQILADSLGNAKAVDRFTGHFFGKGLNVSGFIKSDKLLGKDKDAKDRLKSNFAKAMAGPNNEFGVGILEGGTDWVPNEVDPEKAQLNDTRKVNGQMVAQMFNIPLSFLKYIESTSYNESEQEDLKFTKYTLNPWLVNWEQEYERKLLTESEKKSGNIYFKHNVNALLRGDIASRGQFYERMQRTGAFSPNDIRELEDKNAYEGGDIHVINPGAQSVEELQEAVNNLS